MMWPDRGAPQMSGEDSESLRRLAEQCRRLARGASTAEVASSLREIAANYEQLAIRAAAAEGRAEEAYADRHC